MSWLHKWVPNSQNNNYHITLTLLVKVTKTVFEVGEPLIYIKYSFHHQHNTQTTRYHTCSSQKKEKSKVQTQLHIHVHIYYIGQLHVHVHVHVSMQGVWPLSPEYSKLLSDITSLFTLKCCGFHSTQRPNNFRIITCTTSNIHV